MCIGLNNKENLMSKSDDIKKEVKSLFEKHEKLVKLIEDINDFIKFGFFYQGWYNRAYKF